MLLIYNGQQLRAANADLRRTVPDVVSSVIDLDDPATWPVDEADFLSTIEDATWHRSSPRAYAEHDRLAKVLQLRLRLFHATRLLPHETTSIETYGLRRLSHDLRLERLERAHEAYPELLDAETLALLLNRGPLTWNPQAKRLGAIRLAAPLSYINGSAEVAEHLSYWGGESIRLYLCSDGDRDAQCREAISRLSEESTPTLVELHVPIGHLRSSLISRTSAGQRVEAAEFVSDEPALRIFDLITPDHPSWKNAWVDDPQELR